VLAQTLLDFFYFEYKTAHPQFPIFPLFIKLYLHLYPLPFYNSSNKKPLPISRLKSYKNPFCTSGQTNGYSYS